MSNLPQRVLRKLAHSKPLTQANRPTAREYGAHGTVTCWPWAGLSPEPEFAQAA